MRARRNSSNTGSHRQDLDGEAAETCLLRQGVARRLDGQRTVPRTGRGVGRRPGMPGLVRGVQGQLRRALLAVRAPGQPELGRGGDGRCCLDLLPALKGRDSDVLHTAVSQAAHAAFAVGRGWFATGASEPVATPSSGRAALSEGFLALASKRLRIRTSDRRPGGRRCLTRCFSSAQGPLRRNAEVLACQWYGRRDAFLLRRG